MIAPLALALALGAAAPDPAPSSLVLGWYGDVFDGARLAGERHLRLEAGDGFGRLDAAAREELVAAVFALWGGGEAPEGARYVEVARGGAGHVYRWDPARRAPELVARFDGREPGASLTALRRGRRFFANLSLVLSTGPGTVASARVGTFLLGGRYDASLGLAAAFPSETMDSFALAMIRRHFSLGALPDLAPNLGFQARATQDGDEGGWSWEPGGVAGLSYRLSADGLAELVFFKGSDTTAATLGYTHLF